VDGADLRLELARGVCANGADARLRGSLTFTHPQLGSIFVHLTETAVGLTEPASHGGSANGSATDAADTTGATDVPSELRDAFLLGATISELQGRIRVACLDPTLGAAPQVDRHATSIRESFVPYVEADSNLAWTTSAWRVLFDRIVLLHARFFADSTTRNTLYDPGERMPPYFFPEEEPDYAQVGIAQRPIGRERLADFSLCEATRRGLNCLTLLSIHPDVSLMPEVIRSQQARLLALMPERASGDDGGRDAAISITVQQVLQFIHAWEGYLRESFYAAGVTARNGNNLTAFEVGLSLAWLSWGISVQVLSRRAGETPEARLQHLREVWREAFADSGISRLQHQITIVGTALDAATAAAPGASATESQAATQAVKRSLDYWLRAVKLLLKEEAQGNPDHDGGIGPLSEDDWERLRQALITQTGIWQALVLGQQQLRAYNAEGVAQRIMQDLAVKFQQLAARRGLFGAAEQVTETLVEQTKIAAGQVSAVASTAQAAIAAQIQQGLRTLVRSLWPVLVVLLVITAVGVVVLFQRAMTGQVGNLLVDLATPLLGAASAIGLLFARDRIATTPPQVVPPVAQVAGASAARDSAVPVGAVAPEDRSLGGQLRALAGQVGGEVVEAFSRGFEQVQKDLAALGYSVGVSYPLVEYFVLHEDWEGFKAEIDFLDKVVWVKTARHADIMRVASAAFGPIGVFALAAAESTESDTADASTRAGTEAPQPH